MPRPICYALLLASLIGWTACQKLTPVASSANQTTSTSTPTLIGTWDWVLTHNGGVSSGAWTGSPFGDSTTPINTGIQQVLTFNADSTWTLLQNTALIEQRTFKMGTLLSPEGPIAMLDIIRTGGTDSLVNHTLSQDTLGIFNPQIDSVARIWIYVRHNTASN
jgi:hypothetical protein